MSHTDPAARDEDRDSTLDPTRPASLWPESTRVGGPSTLFPLSRFDPIADERRREQALGAAVLEVCRPALGVRVVLAMQAAALVAGLAAAPAWSAWPRLQAGLAVAALAFALTWLAGLCALSRGLRRRGWTQRAGAAATVGAAGGLVAGGALAWLGHGIGGPRAAGLALAGAGAGLVLWAALEARARLWRVGAPARPVDGGALLGPRLVAGAVSTVQALARVDPVRARVVLDDLGVLAQAALDDHGGATTLDDEVALARRFIGIETERLGARLATTWEVDPRALGAQVPAGLLRVMLDQALRQGGDAGAGAWRLWVRAARQRDEVAVTVSHQVAEGASVGGAALAELRERLRLLHDSRARLDAWQEADVFHARVTLPSG